MEACKAFLAGDYVLAARLYSETSNAIGFCNRAAAHNELGLFRNVIKDANEALVLDDKCLRAHLWKVKGLLSLGKRADALLAVRAALDGVSNSVCDVVLLRELKQLENQCDGESRKSGSDAKVIPQQSNGQTANDSLQNKIQRVAEEHLVQFGVGDKEVDKQIALGYFHTNSGNYTEAIVLFTRLLKKNPKVVAAFLGRGTALAMSGRLKDGVVDFSHAIGLDPSGVEGYRRRGQSLLAMNEQVLAMQDFDKCCRLSPSDAESHHQRGICFYKMRDFERARVAFEMSARLNPESRESWNHLGLTYNQLGRSRDAVAVQETALALDASNADTWSNFGQTFKELGDFEKADEAFSKCLTLQPSNSHTLWLRGMTRYLSGNHVHAMRDFRMCLKLKSDSLEARNLLAVALAARGRYRECVAECDTILKMSPENPVWYSRRLALVTQANLDCAFLDFYLDVLVEDVIKEGHCKRRSPRLACPQQFAAPLPVLAQEVAQSPLEDEERNVLAQAALRFGPKFQYNTMGFLVNKRQWLSAGVAIIQIAQMLSQEKVGGWRELFNLAVRWRQVSEPNDPVWWVDQLPFVQFCEGYGSHTPMVTGQCHTVRYSTQLPRALALVKQLVCASPGTTPTRRQEVQEAETLAELYAAMRRDFWVTTACHSDQRPGKMLEGTRITLQCVAGLSAASGHGVSSGFGYEFSIRTPGTPHRFAEFAIELDLLWQRLCAVRSSFKEGDEDVLLDVTLRLCFFWYNFMPLSRGSAAIGSIVMHAILLSCNVEVSECIPSGYQPDWDAILTPLPDEFVGRMEKWIVLVKSSVLQTAPVVAKVASTVGAALVLLNVVGK